MMWKNLFLFFFLPVSYTHLDVYKRQDQLKCLGHAGASFNVGDQFIQNHLFSLVVSELVYVQPMNSRTADGGVIRNPKLVGRNQYSACNPKARLRPALSFW